MYFWDWKTGYNFQKIQTTVQPGSLDSEAGIFHCCFDQSGCRLLTAEADKTIKIYKEDETAVSDTHTKIECTLYDLYMLCTLGQWNVLKILLYTGVPYSFFWGGGGQRKSFTM